MNYYRKHYLGKDFSADTSNCREPLKIESRHFTTGQLLAYRDPFRSALIRITRANFNENSVSIKAEIVHFSGKEILSRCLFFGFYFGQPSEINLYEPIYYTELVRLELIKDSYALLKKYRGQHSGLLPELKEVFGDSGQKWLDYFAFLAFLSGVENQLQYTISYEHALSKGFSLSSEIMQKIAQNSVFFHNYQRHTFTDFPPALYFNERLSFLLRQIFTAEEEQWIDLESEILSSVSAGKSIVQNDCFYSIDLAKTTLFGVTDFLLLRRKDQMIRAQRYSMAARLRDLEKEHNSYVISQCIPPVVDFFKWNANELCYQLPDDFSIRLVLLLYLPEIFFKNN